jgi:acetyl-CoA synthetase
MIGNFKGEQTKKGSMGKVAPGYDLSILSNHLDIKNYGEDGQIGVNIYPIKPLGILSAYNDEAKNASVFKGGVLSLWRYCLYGQRRIFLFYREN